MTPKHHEWNHALEHRERFDDWSVVVERPITSEIRIDWLRGGWASGIAFVYLFSESGHLVGASELPR